MDVDLSGPDGTTFVSILYGESTDYTAQVHGIGACRRDVIPGAPPEDCSIAVTNMERAQSLPDTTGLL
jgi:hypothetical protein